MAKSDIIRTPGKFEGEPEWVRDLWEEQVMNGFSDEELMDGETPISIFQVNQGMDREYGLKPPIAYVALWESDQGFVNSRTLTKGQYKKLVAELEEAAEEGGGDDFGDFGSMRRGDVEFFKKHAGGVVGERAKGAMALARAEEAAERLGFEVTWEPDSEPWDPGDTDYEPEEVFCAALKDRNGTVRASLCGIADPDRNYRRVVEAELALEAMSQPAEKWSKKRVKMARDKHGQMRGYFGACSGTVRCTTKR